MRRYALAALAALLLLVAAGCGGDLPTAPLPDGPAPPQVHRLDWAESTPATGPGLTFRVRSLEVTATGWRAEVGIDNRTTLRWNLGSLPDDLFPGSEFGLLLLPTGALADATAANDTGRLPPVRRARRITPALPASLAPGQLWDGTIEADGRLPAGIWVRVVLGPLFATEEPPGELRQGVVWFTDHTVQLRG